MRRFIRASYSVYFCFALIALLSLLGCSQVASGDTVSDDDGFAYTPTYIEGGWEFNEWSYKPYFFSDMFDSLEYDMNVRNSYVERWGRYMWLNKIVESTDSVNFYFETSESRRYIFSMDQYGDNPPLLKISTLSKRVEYTVEAIEKEGRWYYPIDQDEFSSEDDYIVLALFDDDGSAYTGEVKNVSVFDNDKVWPLDFDVNLVIAGKFMGTKDDATVEELADLIFERLNQALNPGGIHVRKINILYAKDHPVVGGDYPEEEPFIMARLDDSEYESRTQLSRWPGHEGEFMLVLGYYIVDESNTTLGFAPVPGTVYYDGSEDDYANYVALATHTESGRNSIMSWEIANVSMHELGHYFGLKHTSEYGGKEFDDLEDTPECLDIGERGEYNRLCPDYGYIMYPQTGDAAYVTFTPQQMDVIRMYLASTPHK